MAATDRLSVEELQRQLDQLDERQFSHLTEYVGELPAERRSHLHRIAAHLAERFGRVIQPQVGAVHWYSHTDETGKHDGFELRVVGRPDLSGFVTFQEWIYLSRRAAEQAIERARVRVGPDFNTAHEIRSMRDASTGVQDGLLTEAAGNSEPKRRR